MRGKVNLENCLDIQTTQRAHFISSNESLSTAEAERTVSTLHNDAVRRVGETHTAFLGSEVIDILDILNTHSLVLAHSVVVVFFKEANYISEFVFAGHRVAEFNRLSGHIRNYLLVSSEA